MTTYDSGTIAIPGMDWADAVAGGTVSTITTEAWNDGDCVAIDPATGLWRKGGNGPVIASGAKTFSASSASVKILPYLQVGLLGSNTDNAAAALRYALANNPMTWTVPNGGELHRWPIRVKKKAGEVWAASNNLWRQDDPANADFGAHSITFTATSSLAGAAAGAAATADTIGLLSVDLLQQEPFTTSTSSGGHAPDLIEVAKPTGETWFSTGAIYTNGVLYSIQNKAGWTRCGYTPKSYSVGVTRAVINRKWMILDGLAARLHRMRVGTWCLMPANSLHRVFWQEVQYDGGAGLATDQYFLNFRNYVLAQPVTMLSQGGAQVVTANPSFPGLAIDLPTAPFTGGGTWGMPAGQAVIWTYGNAGATGSLRGMLYQKDTTGSTLTGRRIPRARTVLGATHFPATDHTAYTEHLEGSYSSSRYNQQTRRGTPRRVYVYFTGSPTSTTPEFNLEELQPDQTVGGSTKTKWVSLTGWTSAGSIPLTGGTLFLGSTTIVGSAYKLTRNLRMSVRYTTGVSVSTFTGLANDLWRVDNLGTLPFEYDVPRWNALIQPAGAALVTVPYLGATLSPPASDVPTWSGGYTVTAALVSGAYQLTIVSTRKSVIASSDAEKYTKVTTWFVEAISPDNGAFAQPFTAARTRTPQRLALNPSSVTRDAWNDIVAFTDASSVSLGNPTAATITYTVVIVAITESKSLWRESMPIAGITNWVRHVDRYAVTVAIPPT